MVKGEIVKTNPDPTEAVKEALTLAIKNLDEKFDLRFRNVEENTSLARKELGERLDAFSATINERWQTQKESTARSEVSMSDTLKQLTENFNTASRATNEKIDRLTSRLDTGEGSSAIRDPSVTVSLNKLTNAVETLQETRSQNIGGNEKQNNTWQIIFGIGGLMITAVIVIEFLLKH